MALASAGWPRPRAHADHSFGCGTADRASVGTSLLNTIFAAAVTSYLAAHLASARLIGRQALTGLALAHGYDTAFWWTAGIFAGGAVVGGALLRRGPLNQTSTPSQAHGGITTAQAEASRERAQ
jgi:hypothetical protein